MPIHFRCTTCNKLLSIARRKAGQSIECPVCGANIRVPEEIPSKPIIPIPPKGDPSPIQSPLEFPDPNPPTPEIETLSHENPSSSSIPETIVPPPPAISPIPAPEPAPISPPAKSPLSGIRPKPTASTQPKSQSPSSSILELDPDTLFRSSPSKGSKPSATQPHPGILDEMYSGIPESESQADLGEENSSPEVIVEPTTKPSWKLILFGLLLTGGLIVAAFLAWKLVFSSPS